MTLNSIMSHELIGKDAIFNYVTGGHAVVTLQSESGIHHTYSFHAPKERKPGEDTLFISTLVDSNTWVYVGMYKNKDFHFTKASAYSKDSAIVKGIAFILKLMLKDGFHDDRMHLYHEGVCCRCGRPLTNPASIALGIGPTCAEMGV